MTYDIFCYKPRSNTPSTEEVHAMEEEHNQAPTKEDEETKQKIVAALLEFNPRLQIFKPDFKALAKSQNISEEEARVQYTIVELNPPVGDLQIQLFVGGDSVGIGIPYWYEGEEAGRVFALLNDYLRIIRRVAGFFVYDSQREIAWDPEKSDFGSLDEYEHGVRCSRDLAKKI